MVARHQQQSATMERLKHRLAVSLAAIGAVAALIACLTTVFNARRGMPPQPSPEPPAAPTKVRVRAVEAKAGAGEPLLGDERRTAAADGNAARGRAAAGPRMCCGKRCGSPQTMARAFPLAESGQKGAWAQTDGACLWTASGAKRELADAAGPGSSSRTCTL